MVLRVSPGPEALSPAGPGLCACPHAREPWGVHVCTLSVWALCTVGALGRETGKGAGRQRQGVWFLVTEKL